MNDNGSQIKCDCKKTIAVNKIDKEIKIITPIKSLPDLFQIKVAQDSRAILLP